MRFSPEFEQSADFDRMRWANLERLNQWSQKWENIFWQLSKRNFQKTKPEGEERKTAMSLELLETWHWSWCRNKTPPNIQSNIYKGQRWHCLLAGRTGLSIWRCVSNKGCYRLHLQCTIQHNPPTPDLSKTIMGQTRIRKITTILLLEKKNWRKAR